MEVNRVYTYKRNGKDVKIKRSWTKTNSNINKNSKLDEYFENNMDKIKDMKSIKSVYNDFMECNPESKISYSMVYNKYQKHFNTRKAQEHPRQQKTLETVPEDRDEIEPTEPE